MFVVLSGAVEIYFDGNQMKNQCHCGKLTGEL